MQSETASFGAVSFGSFNPYPKPLLKLGIAVHATA
jgi:hypothetical protein